ncbi:hypothetical protein [Nitrospira sp. Kam-Ns4a]
MLKITVRPRGRATEFALEGRLAGPWVAELDRCWRAARAAGAGPIVVDLSDVTFVDADGQVLLRALARAGAALRGSGCLINAIVHEITGTEYRRRTARGDRMRGSTSRGRGRA